MRHHWPETAYGLRLQGALTWSGDTRPIPEMLARFANDNELIAHDCGLHGNPSHTGVDDLEREYSADLQARMMLYHYASAADGQALARAGTASRSRGSACRWRARPRRTYWRRIRPEQGRPARRYGAGRWTGGAGAHCWPRAGPGALSQPLSPRWAAAARVLRSSLWRRVFHQARPSQIGAGPCRARMRSRGQSPLPCKGSDPSAGDGPAG